MAGNAHVGPIGASGNVLGVESITDEIRAELSRIGRNASDFNTFNWSGVGASRYSRGMFLMHKSRVDQLLTSTDTLFDFRFDGIILQRVFMRNPVPVFTSEGTGAIYSVEFVDERYLWNQGSVQNLPEALNLSLTDKAKLFDDSEGLDGPWSLQELLEEIISNELAYLDSPLTLDAWDFSEIDVDSVFTEDIRDIRTRGLSPGMLIDKLLQATGHVLVVNQDLAADQIKFRVVPIGSGESDVSDELLLWGARLLAGGIYSPSSDILPSEGIGSVAGGPSEWIASEVPTTVAVHFPLAQESGTGYDFSEDSSGDGVHYPTNRYHTIMTNAGRPSVTTGNMSTKAVFATRWAIQTEDGIQDDEILESRAEVYSTRYYDRFRSGVGNMLFAGGIPFRAYSGSHEIIYTLTHDMVTTRVKGSYDFPLFGFTSGSNEPITATDIFTGSRIRTSHRPDSSVLFDILPETSRIHYGKITAIQGTLNATYDAEAIDDSGISVSNQTPIRLFNPANVDHTPAVVDDPCILGVRQDNETIDLYVPTETVQTVDCASSPAAQSQQNARIFEFHGGIG